MHTARSLTVSPSMHCSVGGAWSRGCLLPGAGGGESAFYWGVSGPRGCTEADPPVDRMTDTCKKHNLRKLRLRAVKITLN